MMDLLPVLLVNGVVFGAIYAINAIGIGLVYNTTGIINFAQGEFIMLGGMLTACLYGQAGLPLLVAIIGGVALTVVVGLLTERLFIRPLWRRGAKDWTYVFMLFAVATVLPNLVMLGVGRDPLTFPTFGGLPAVQLGSVTLSSQALWVLLVTVAVFFALQGFFDRTLLGKAMKATAINRRVAAWLGIAVEQMVAMSFGLAALLGAIGGVVFTPLISTQFDAGVSMTLNGFAAAIIGGMGNMRGAIVGGLVIGILQSISTAFISSVYGDAVTYAVLFGLLVVWPHGLFRPLIELKNEEI
ncbi:branched-chain amino acid ABC transporter permease [Bosea minatitlanensis]|uniref:Branched-chain amino acid ABC transporter permease n=1 Tax=Bosea minatitlanensis TaxID=128782 RepID=A0ABW0F5J4_9HYPH|nr:branched-chain amino acid ABC transporter permease [Bosea minatitlanensis]MCT4493453.1 branched-chain amino acid ABC transporter permease [Bosea minatitlanensis]